MFGNTYFSALVALVILFVSYFLDNIVHIKDKATIKGLNYACAFNAIMAILFLAKDLEHYL